MPYYEHGPGGQIVMICAVCRTRCHADGSKQVHVLDEKESARLGRQVYRQAECPVCVCHDCVQLADDPIRAGLAPQILGQTMAAPFNIEQAIREMQGHLGFRGPEPPRHALPRAAPCRCGDAARSRCIACDEPLCGRCVQVHDDVRCPHG